MDWNVFIYNEDDFLNQHIKPKGKTNTTHVQKNDPP